MFVFGIFILASGFTLRDIWLDKRQWQIRPQTFQYWAGIPVSLYVRRKFYAIQIVPHCTVSYECWALKMTKTSPSVLSGVALDNNKVLFVNRIYLKSLLNPC